MLQDEIVISDVQPPDWDALVKQFPMYTAYHTLAWLQTVEAAHHIKLMLTKAEQGGRCVGAWPFLETRKGPLKIFGSPLPGWSTAYLGPLVDDNADFGAVLEAFVNSRQFQPYSYFNCKAINAGHGTINLERFGFTQKMAFETYRVDLTQPETTLWDNLKSECRTRIRKATKLGIELRSEEDEGFIDDYWPMTIDTYAKSNLQPPHDRQFVVELWRRMRPAGTAHAMSAMYDGRRVATLLLIHDSHTQYYWGGASYARDRSLPAHNLLHWQAILDGKQRGLRGYDLLGTMGGPGRFKSTFGPQAVVVATHWERSASRIVAVLKTQYEKYLWRRRQVHQPEEVVTR